MIARFFSWWFAELASFLPRGGRAGGGRHGRMLLVELTGETVRVVVEGGRGRAQDIPRGDAAALRAALSRTAQGLDPGRTRVQVRVPARVALQTNPTLPLAAEENLLEVLGFEMDRLTPFRASDVYFSYQVTSRDRARQSLNVDLSVVRRSVVDPMLQGLEGWDLGPAAPAGVDAVPGTEGAPVSLDFVSSRYHEPSASRVNTVLAAMVLALAVAAVVLPLRQQAGYRIALDEQLRAARAEAARSLQVREELELEARAAEILAGAKGTRANTVEVLELVSQLLPDHTYLFRFEIKGNTLSLQGSSDAASSLIAVLDASDDLTGVRFVSPVTRDARSGGERFHISAELLPRNAAVAGTGQGS
jgi:general secretion pathway protein L